MFNSLSFRSPDSRCLSFFRLGFAKTKPSLFFSSHVSAVKRGVKFLEVTTKMQWLIDLLIERINPIPSGTIILWSSTGGTVPNGYFACNGANGTPDLRGKFVRGAGTGYPFGGVGGSATHTHGTGKGMVSGAGRNSTGDNIPPYHNLFYIMKA